MNIESTSTTVKSTATDTSASSNVTSPNESKTSFKDELESVKTQEVKTKEAKNLEQENVEKADAASKGEAAEKSAQEKTVQQSEKDKLVDTTNKNKGLLDELQAEDAKNPLFELSSKIAVINGLKGSTTLNKTSEKADELKLASENCFKTMNMEQNDITFFVNLVQNQQTGIQNGQISIDTSNLNAINSNSTEIKNEATGKTVQVSSALMDALTESMKTNKPFRVDFGSDVAVIMKVDKNGVLSANFIPGSAAVEAYLKNNIASLRQNFDNQNLPYNELSYSKQQKQEQNENQQKKHKENEND